MQALPAQQAPKNRSDSKRRSPCPMFFRFNMVLVLLYLFVYLSINVYKKRKIIIGKSDKYSIYIANSKDIFQELFGLYLGLTCHVSCLERAANAHHQEPSQSTLQLVAQQVREHLAESKCRTVLNLCVFCLKTCVSFELYDPLTQNYCLVNANLSWSTLLPITLSLKTSQIAN